MNVFERYGIKEVADCTFFELDTNGKPTKPVLYLDTLKVSTIEQTAENVSARGGKANPEIITWDFGKEITVTLEDALFSAKSMAIMFGNGIPTTIESKLIMKAEYFTPTTGVSLAATYSADTTDALTSADITALENAGWKKYIEDKRLAGSKKAAKKLNAKFYDGENATPVTSLAADQRYLCVYDVAIDGHVITISADSFPGTYYVTGDTYARSAASGNDEYFQFIINKAKVTSENTITLEAEGDPSTFSMSLRVLRPDNGSEMMKLVQYTFNDSEDYTVSITDGTGDSIGIYHNHDLPITAG